MTIPVEPFTAPAPAPASHLADSDFEAFALNAPEEADGLYVEITERRAQLENADILRRARAL